MVACPNCGKDLSYIQQYDRFYCFSCGQYAPKGYGAGPSGPAIQLGGGAEPQSHDGHYHCPSCGKELAYIAQWQRWYCYAEQKYAPRDIQAVGSLPIATGPAPAETVPTGSEAPVDEVAAAEPAEIPVVESAPESVVTESPVSEPEPAAEPAPAPVVTPEETTIPSTEESPQPGAEISIIDLSPVTEPSTIDGSAKLDRPKLTATKVQKAKKAKLIEWCRAYGLDTHGTRTELRDRLLDHLDEHALEVDEEPGEAREPLPIEPATETQPVTDEAPISEVPAPEPPAVTEPVSVSEPEPTVESREPYAEPPPAEPVAEPAPTTDAPSPIEPSPSLPVSEPEPTPAQEPSPEPEREPTPTAAPPLMEPPKVEPPAESQRPEPIPSPAIPALPPLPVEVEKPLACPHCGKDLTYISKYDRLYCFSCGRYAPRDFGKAPVVEAPAPIPMPAPPPVVVEIPKPVPKVEHQCPTCGREMRYVREYDRWWCDFDRRYAPKVVRNPCPTCGKELTYVAQYSRWYCHAEQLYAPRTYVASGPAVAVVARPIVTGPAVRAQPVTAPAVSAAVRPEHLHGRPGTGIGIAAMGFVLLLFPRLLVLLVSAGILQAASLPAFPPYFYPLLEFLGIVLALIGVAVGLRSVRGV